MRSSHLKKSGLVVNRYDNDFILIRSGSDRNMMALAEYIQEKKLPAIQEVIGTESEICLKLGNGFNAETLALLSFYSEKETEKKRIYKLPVCMEWTLDWSMIEDITELHRGSIKEDLLKLELTYTMHGFLPGFMYLSGLPDRYCLPRKSKPSVQVDAGAVAIGGKYLGIYALPSPGGWHVLGSCPLKIFDKVKIQPTRLKIGDRLKLETISLETYHRLKEESLTLKQYNEQV